MNVYIPFCMAMLEHLNKELSVDAYRVRALNISDDRRSWVRFDIVSQVWTYFEVDVNHKSYYIWHLGTYEDFTALLLIADSHARYTYAQANCKTGKVIYGEAHYGSK